MTFFFYLLVCGAVLLAFAYLAGPKPGWIRKGSLLTGVPLVLYSGFTIATGRLHTNLLAPLITITAFEAVVVIFTGILVAGTSPARERGEHPLIPQVLLRVPWRERRYGLVQRLAAVILIVGAIAVAVFMISYPDRAEAGDADDRTVTEARI